MWWAEHWTALEEREEEGRRGGALSRRVECIRESGLPSEKLFSVKNVMKNPVEKFQILRVREDDELIVLRRYCRCSSDGLTSVFSPGRDKDNAARTHAQTNAKFTSDPP